MKNINEQLIEKEVDGLVKTLQETGNYSNKQFPWDTSGISNVDDIKRFEMIIRELSKLSPLEQAMVISYRFNIKTMVRAHTFIPSWIFNKLDWAEISSKLFVSPESKTFIFLFDKYIKWNYVPINFIRHYKLFDKLPNDNTKIYYGVADDEVILRNEEDLVKNPNILSRQYRMSLEMIDKYKDIINWKIFTYHLLCYGNDSKFIENVLTTYCDRLNWTTIFIRTNFSLDFVKKFKDRINPSCIGRYLDNLMSNDEEKPILDDILDLIIPFHESYLTDQTTTKLAELLENSEIAPMYLSPLGITNDKINRKYSDPKMIVENIYKVKNITDYILDNIDFIPVNDIIYYLIPVATDDQLEFIINYLRNKGITSKDHLGLINNDLKSILSDAEFDIKEELIIEDDKEI